MINVPVNRWTIAALVAAAAYFGGDLAVVIMKVVAILSAPYVPAV